MLTDSDWTQIAVDLAAIRGDNETALQLRRAEFTLPAQAARIAGRSSAARTGGTQTTESVRQIVTVLFAAGADVQPQDRFTHNGQMYRIVGIRANTRAAVTCDAEMEA